ncbi:glycosyltransferase [uncultured Mucilaginibacter sp.]|uniref:glycosyltransferase n=1 Tax=uncultured Mucilaginibacter sp. TaxID=797541 RepID=UPI002622DA32|nr:glycosyltransferase [uncultured Mucilaginibacter sp.]
MKLLHITASMDPKVGGVCQAVRTIVKSLGVYPDVQNTVISFDAADASFIGQNSDYVEALGTGKGPWFYNPNYLPWLLKNLPQFDAVILHGLWNYQGFGLIKALNQLKKRNASFTPKFYVMPHGMLDPYFQKASGRKLKALRNWFYWKFIERKVVNQADGLLFTCEAELQLARTTFKPYLPKKELVVGLGVDEPPAFTPAMRDAFLKKCPGLIAPYLLFISRIHPKKGADLLVDAYIKTQPFNNLKEEADRLNTNTVFIGKKLASTKLVVAGPGLETPYGQKIKAAAANFKQAETAIYFPEMLTGDAKWGAFYGCEAFVLPSHQENFGIAVVEALACGKPVLISNQVNIWTEIAAAQAGIIADDTIAGTEQLLENWFKLSSEEKLQMGKNARQCYEKHFAVAPAAQRFSEAIKN